MGHIGIVETVGLMTLLTVEVRMLVVVVLMTMTVAELVLGAVAAALDGVYQMVLLEEHQGTEYVRLVDSQDLPLEFCQRLGLHGRGKGLGHHDTVGGGFDAVLLEQSDAGCFVHDGWGYYLILLQRYKIILNFSLFTLHFSLLFVSL